MYTDELNHTFCELNTDHVVKALSSRITKFQREHIFSKGQEYLFVSDFFIPCYLEVLPNHSAKVTAKLCWAIWSEGCVREINIDAIDICQWKNVSFFSFLVEIEKWKYINKENNT